MLRLDTANIPFYGNTSDNTHCYQAVVKMILKYYFPDEEYSWQRLDTMTGKKEGLWTWPMMGWVSMAEKGLEVQYIGTFDYKKFVDDGEEYLIDRYGEEVGREQIAHSDIDYEREVSKRLISGFDQVNRIPDYNEIGERLRDGWLVLTNVNYYSLYGKSGYAGHFVLILEVGENYVLVHDPGLTHKPNEMISSDKFMNAWNYSGKVNRWLTLVRKRT